MPVTYEISHEERLIKAVSTGIIRADDLHQHIRSLLADPDFVPGLRALYDSRHAEPDITILQLAEVAGEVRKLWNLGLGRIALVVGSQVAFRVAKTFSVLARAVGIDVDVFTELSEAETWLGKDAEPSDSGEKPLPH
jgi:hypothetical protein